jgi:hypothetical protein
MTADIAAMQVVIRRLHGCESTYVESVPVSETFHGKIVWDGTVEIFSLTDHPKAKRCFVWSYRQDDGALTTTAVLEYPPVDSPIAAVRASIAAAVKSRE